MNEEIETGNDQMVSTHGEDIIVMMPKHRMSKEEALRHAAWIAVLADMTGDEFVKVLEAVKNT